MKKRIGIEVLPGSKSAEPATIQHKELSKSKIGIYLLLIAAGIAGFFVFDFKDVVTNIFNPGMISVDKSNSALGKTVDKSLIDVNTLKHKLDDIDKINTKLSTLSGRNKPEIIVNYNIQDSLSLNDLKKYVKDLKKSYKRTLRRFDENPKWLASMPLIHPVKGEFYISSYFTYKLDLFTGKHLPHLGLDYVAPIGDTIYATGKGWVANVEKDDNFGHSITIQHNNDVESFYAHMKRPLTRSGRHIKRGQPIGIMGNSGRSSGPHLHYELRVNKKRVNPANYILADF